ncbi:nuclear transport factor 2 family protein [Saccharopolyspora sp. MS10]|uniref:nuclear transport factor 2 family protein n=1 Tax=Saccharopolyspora sp. MS10 TaxID=3385973 RepID=UPI0039A18684
MTENETGTGSEPAAPAPGPAAKRPLVISAALLAVALLAAVVTGVSWAIAANGGTAAFAAERDDALQAGTQGIINFNTLDHRDVQGGLDRWEASSTGPLHEDVVRGRQQYVDTITQAKTVTSAEVLSAGLTELNERAGKARMIAVVKVVVTPEGQPPTEKRSRYQAELTRENDQWKLSVLGPVAVG